MKSQLVSRDAYAITVSHNKLPSVLAGSRRICYTFYGVIGWFGKYMEIKAA